MEYSKIIAITGKPGLFEAISQTKTGFIVESLLDKKRFPVPSTNNVSLIENIAIYTYEEEIPLLNVFKTIFEKENGAKAINHKESGNKLTAYFSEVLPDYDEDRVYTSNIKKVIQWYNILVEAGLDFSKVKTTEENTEEA
mgnify:CR=1 FL=1